MTPVEARTANETTPITPITSNQLMSAPNNPVSGWAATYRTFFLPIDPVFVCGLLYVCQDARPYIFAGRPRIMVTNDSETFALINPSTSSCP